MRIKYIAIPSIAITLLLTGCGQRIMTKIKILKQTRTKKKDNKKRNQKVKLQIILQRIIIMKILNKILIMKKLLILLIINKENKNKLILIHKIIM